MADVKFTPGPWIHTGSGDVETVHGNAVCTTDACNEVDIADAHLIAASPDGHAVARTLCALLDGFVIYDDGVAEVADSYDFACAVLNSGIHELVAAYLAKAEGKS